MVLEPVLWDLLRTTDTLNKGLLFNKLIPIFAKRWIFIGPVIKIADVSVAFRQIFEKYYPSQYFFASALLKDGAEAEDVVQDVFTSLWKHLPSFPNETALKVYLYVLTRNSSLDYIRRRISRQKNI